MSTTEANPRYQQSFQLWQRTKDVLGGGVSTGIRSHMPPHPIFFDRGKGSRLWDIDGHEYVDYVLGWGPLILGHSHPSLVQAVTEQLPRGLTFGSGHPLEFEAADAVCAAMPGVERVLWSNTGSEAVQSALRLARAATGRQKVVKFEGHYHGWNDSMLVSYRHIEPGHRPALESLGQNPAASQDVITVAWNEPDDLAEILSEHGDQVAAVITEPVLCNSGVIAPQEGFLEYLRDATRDCGALLIFDEVITGFRIARGGAAERYGVVPDLHTLGKALAGGFSASAVAGRADLIDLVSSGVVHAGTYNGNPVVLSAVRATLGELAAAGVYENLEARGRELADGFRAALAGRGTDFAVNQVGAVVQCALGISQLDSFEEFLAADWATYDRLVVALLDRGIFALPGGRWYLSTEHTRADVASTVDAFAEAVKATL